MTHAAETRPDTAETRPNTAETRPDTAETRPDSAKTRQMMETAEMKTLRRILNLSLFDKDNRETFGIQKIDR